MKEDLRGIFIIIKGQYRRKAPIMTYKEKEYYIGGYDPEDESTMEWYRVVDKELGICAYAGSSLERALLAVRREIIRNKDLRTYEKRMRKYTRTNPNSINMDRCVDEEYGFYFRDKIRAMEDEAYAFLEDNTSVKKAKRRFKKIGNEGIELAEKSEEVTEKKTKAEKLVMHRIKLAVR